MAKQTNLRFPKDIKLSKAPLAEAWFELKWELSEGPQGEVDQGFAFALGSFFERIKDTYKYQEELSAAQAPVEFTPYMVRHRFRATPDGFPVLQIGPGVATVNYNTDYTWNVFVEQALYLCNSLVEAYKGIDRNLIAGSIGLRYRNSEDFDFKAQDALAYIRENLNVKLTLPDNIPGSVSPKQRAKDINLALVFPLSKPKGEGYIRIATGRQQNARQPKPQLIWDLGVTSTKGNAPSFESESQVRAWLENAHNVTHEWFFSLIAGNLRNKYD